MAVEARIKQKSLFKKKLKIDNTIGVFELSYGISDENFRLMMWKTDEHTLIYDKDNLSRGIDFSIENNDVVLRLSLPTTKEEIELFYSSIEKMCKYLKNDSYMRDSEIVNIKDNNKYIEMDIKTSISAIKDIDEKIKNDIDRFYIFGINNPIALGKKEMKEIVDNYEAFSKLLDKLQRIDAFYAAPKVFKDKNNKLFAMYAVMPNNLTIVPTEPYILFRDTNDIDNWYVYFDDNQIIKYNDFINNVKNKEYYDDNHVLVKVSEKEIKDLVEKYHAEI